MKSGCAPGCEIAPKEREQRRVEWAWHSAKERSGEKERERERDGGEEGEVVEAGYNDFW